MKNQNSAHLQSLRDAAVAEYQRAAAARAAVVWTDLTEAVCQWLPDGDYEAMQALMAAARPLETKDAP
jgi:hypothetical protein